MNCIISARRLLRLGRNWLFLRRERLHSSVRSKHSGSQVELPGGQRRSHRQHERAQAWPLYRGSHRAAASALRADQDGAGYPRRAQGTALEAPKRTAFKARSAPSSGRALLARCTPFNYSAAVLALLSEPRRRLVAFQSGRAAGALDCPGGAQDAHPGVVRACAEPEVRIHFPPAASQQRTRPRSGWPLPPDDGSLVDLQAGVGLTNSAPKYAVILCIDNYQCRAERLRPCPQQLVDICGGHESAPVSDPWVQATLDNVKQHLRCRVTT